MKAFVLCEGEYSEGHSPKSAHVTLEAAKAAALDRMGAPITFWLEAEPGRWRGDMRCRVDEAWIYALEVSP